MALKTIQCREHGGTFQIEARRGRPPVACGKQTNGNEYPLCDAAPKAQSKRRVAEAMASPLVQETVKRLTLAEWRKAAKNAGFSAKIINQMRTPAMFRELLGEDNTRRKAVGLESIPELVPAEDKPALESARTKIRERQTVIETSPVSKRVNPSIPKARAAKALLEPQGWTVAEGRAWFDGESAYATVIATRGEEDLAIRWMDGRLDSQNYSLWNVDKPSANNTPNHKLPFDPDEMTDSELVRAMSGTKVTWWNRIAQSTETAVISKESVKVVHSFNGRGDETPADRVISFVDMNGGGFRSFRMGALLKIG